MNTSVIIGTVVFGIAMLIGLYGIRNSPNIKWPFYILAIGGAYVFISSTIGPLSNSQDRLDEITKIEAAQVLEVKLMPTRQVGEDGKSLFPDVLIIKDTETIERMCQALNGAYASSTAVVKDAEWLVRMEIKGLEYDTVFGVRDEGEKTCIDVGSRGEYGWQYGNLWCNELGPILEELARNQ